MEVTRLFDLLPHYATHFSREDALCGKENGVWKHYSTKQYVNIVNNISYGLMQLGIKKGDKIASISAGRPEWNFLDMAIMQLGAIHVPIYPTISENDYKYILHHADVKMVFVSGWDILRKIENLLSEIPQLKDNVYTFRNLRGYRHLNEVIELGVANPSVQYLNEIRDRITPDDIATIIYTSGTTGTMKGVQLSHRNIISNFKAILPIVPTHAQTRVLSYLPLCHIYERMMIYAWHYLGIPIYYAESIGTIASDLQDVKPTIFTTVPRLLEKFYDRFVATGRKLPKRQKKLFFWADDVASRYELEGRSGKYNRSLQTARMLVLNKFKDALGGKIDVIVSGGAAIQPRLCRIFWAAGMPVLEGYGLTETSPVIAVSSFFKDGMKFGTVGQPLPGVEVKIAEDGEILTRGACLTKGYLNAEEQTKEAIDEEGWFHTGDMGAFEPEGQLRITGRKKEMFKTAFGKYIVPTHVESVFAEDSLIDNIMVVGENKKFAAALIVPNFADLRSWCAKKEIPYTTNEEMIKHPMVLKKYKKVADQKNATLGETERVMKFALMDYEWGVSTGELTPTLKLKRRFITQKHADVIESLFE
ncbi:MAG: long-chain fatty acid--CoA ligase [Bacteroidales bacterium]|nr:long-chain fatty acid--CoA ligase [Bacteroidales bacterium]